MKHVWQLIDQTWVPKEYQSKNKRMNKRDKECTWVIRWLLNGKQRLVNEHRIIARVTK